MPEQMKIEDIARLAGVSVSTVSRVLNSHPDVSSATRQRVLEVISSHDYIPNDSARSLKRESFHGVGIMVKGIDNPFFGKMLRMIREELDRRRYQILLQPVEVEEDEIDTALSLVKDKKPEGLIFLGGNFQNSSAKLAMLDIPYVMATITLKGKVDRASFSSVAVDDRQETYSLAEHLISAGHSRFAIIASSSDDRSVSKLRVDGFVQALEEHHLPPPIMEYAGGHSMEGGYEAASRLSANPEITCLFCISDLIAIGAMRALYDSGRSIPGDISVVSFDGIPAARFSLPSLATVVQPVREIAIGAVELLLDRLERKQPNRHCILPAEFVWGESFQPLV
ncbi:MAG: LacI family DNA-binding transcriptional regulator [Oscillospiraceae bacterium]